MNETILFIGIVLLVAFFVYLWHKEDMKIMELALALLKKEGKQK